MNDLINNKTKKIPPFISLVILYHNFVNISTVSPVRICLQTRKDAQSAEMHLQNFEKLQSRKDLVKYSALPNVK